MIRRAVILPLLLLTVVMVLVIEPELAANQDSYVALAAPLASYGHADTLSVAAGGLGMCAPSEISYLRFDLRQLQKGPISNAALLLKVTYATGSNSGNLVLYAASDLLANGSLWQEDTLTWSNQPGAGGLTRLATVPVPIRSGDLRVESRALAAVINQEASFGGTNAGDDVLTVALQIEDCAGLNSIVRFASTEHSSAAAPALTFSPPLQMYLPIVH